MRAVSERTPGVWTVGRIFVDTPMGRDQWLVDYVLDAMRGDRLVGLSRSRPSRGHIAPLSRVIGEACTAPLDGPSPPLPRPPGVASGPAVMRLPKRIEFLDMHVYRELEAMKLPVELVPSRRRHKTIEGLVEKLIEGYLEPDGHWHWLQAGVSARTMDRLFDLTYRLANSFAWYTLDGREIITVHYSRRRETRWLRLVARRRLDNQLEVALHVATRETTLDSWRRGELGPDTVVIAAVDQDELPVVAWDECCRLGRQGSTACPAITVGGRRRMPSPVEVALAAEALESFLALLDEPFTPELLELRALPSGEEIRVEVGRPELVAFPRNDGGLELELVSRLTSAIEQGPSQERGPAEHPRC